MGNVFGSVYKQLFEQHPGILDTPMLTIGRKWLFEDPMADLCFPPGKTMTYRTHDIKSLDLYDPKADLKIDLNYPMPVTYHERFKVLIDIGTIEHIFDTAQCLENYFRMLRPGGLILLHTPVEGYCDHGYHTFAPKALHAVLDTNGFKILWDQYVDIEGKEAKLGTGLNVNVFILARKMYQTLQFIPPHQGRWKSAYQ